MQGLLRVGRKQGQGWTAKQITVTFVGCTCGSVNVTSFEENLKELQVLESKWGKMRADLARKLLEEQDTVFNGITKPSGAMGTEDQVGRVQKDENM